MGRLLAEEYRLMRRSSKRPHRTLVGLRPWLILAMITGMGATATAELYNPDLVCRPIAPELTPHERLRALSFDLRGIPPTMEEYSTVTELGAVPANLVGEWLYTDAFKAQIIRLHRSMFWNELNNLRLGHNRMRLSKASGIWWRRDQARTYRGGADRHRCLNQPATYTSDGELEFAYFVDEFGQEVRQEGYVELSPYWAPNDVVKVCALDAQDVLIGDEGTDCATRANWSDSSCGCGPEMRWCLPDAASAKVLSGFEDDLDRRVAWMLDSNKSYDAMLTEAPAFINGPISHYLRHQAQFGGSLQLAPMPFPMLQIPVIDYSASNTWIGIELTSSHSGALSSPAFLLRFQTNRARASKFSTEFLCDPYVAPSGGLPPTTDEEAMEPDLQKRAGCKYCHARLEPTASYWGRFPESGAGLLSKEDYPAFSPECEACALKTGPCPSLCSKYVTKAEVDSEEAYFGWLKQSLFIKPNALGFIDQGPAALVKRSIVDQKLPMCVTRKMASWLFGRGLHPSESAWLDEVAQNFAVSGLNLRELIRTLATSPMYGAVR